MRKALLLSAFLPSLAILLLSMLALAAAAHVPVSTPDGTPPVDEPPVLDDEPLPPVMVNVGALPWPGFQPPPTFLPGRLFR